MKLQDISPKTADKKIIPSYYNPHNIPQDTELNSFPLVKEADLIPDPNEEIRKKYPIKTIIGIAVLIVMVLAIPVGVFLNQKPTKVFIEATATPSPTPTPTPTPTLESTKDFLSTKKLSL